MTSLYPNAFRSFRDVCSLYARNLPLRLRKIHPVPTTPPTAPAAEGGGWDDSGLDESETPSATTPSAETALVPSTGTSFIVLRDFFSSSPFSAHSLLADDSDGVVNISNKYRGTRVESMAYRSAICVCTQHPAWGPLPPALTAAAADCDRFTVEVWCLLGSSSSSSSGGSAPSGCSLIQRLRTPLLASSYAAVMAGSDDDCDNDSGCSVAAACVLVASVAVDTTRLRFLGATAAEADERAAATATATAAAAVIGSTGHGSGSSSGMGGRRAAEALQLFFRCGDGIFALTDTNSNSNINVNGATTDAHGGRKSYDGAVESGATVVPWSRSPAGCGYYYYPHRYGGGDGEEGGFSAATGGSSGRRAEQQREWLRARGVTTTSTTTSITTADGSMTAGDLRALVGSSLAWRHLHSLTAARGAETLAGLATHGNRNSNDGDGDGDGDDVQAEVRRATAEAARREATAATTAAAATVAALVAAVARRRRQLSATQSAVAALEQELPAAYNGAHHTNDDDDDDDESSPLSLTVRPTTTTITTAITAAAAVSSSQAEERRGMELQRAHLRSALARALQSRAAALATAFGAIELAPRYAGACPGNPRNGKDSIGGNTFPVFLSEREGGSGGGSGGVVQQRTDTGGGLLSGLFGSGTSTSVSGSDTAAAIPGLVATSADAMFDEAVALGRAAHLVQALATLYGCALPHPVLMAGARSRVMVRAGAGPREAAGPVTLTTLAAAAIGGNGSAAGPGTHAHSGGVSGGGGNGVAADGAALPLYCQRGVVDRPVVRAAVALLVRDCACIARAMGKDEGVAVAAHGLRIGAVLRGLLAEW